MDFDLNSILSAITGNIQNTGRTALEISRLDSEREGLQQQRALAASEGTDSQGNTIASKQAELDARQRSQAGSVSFARTNGTDMGTSGELLSYLGLAYNETSAKAQAAQDEVIRKQSVGFFDNPLMYMVNQTTVNEDEAKAKALTDKATMLKTQLMDINAATQTVAATQRAIEQSVTDASKLSQVEAVNANITERILAVKLDANANHVQYLKDMSALSTAQLSSMMNGYQARNQEAQLALAREREARILAKEKEAEADDAEYARLMVLGSNGKLKGMTDKQLNTVVNGAKRTGDIATLTSMQGWFQQGVMYDKDPSLVGQFLAPTPADAYKRAVAGYKDVPASMALTVKALKDIAAQIPEGTQDKDRAGWVNQRFDDKVQQDASKIKYGDQGNIFNGISYKSLVASKPELANHPIIKLAEEQQTEDPSVLMKVAAARNINLAAFAKQFAELQLRKEAAAVVTSGIDNIGAAPPKEFKYLVDVGGVLSRSEYVKLSDPVEVSRVYGQVWLDQRLGKAFSEAMKYQYR